MLHLESEEMHMVKLRAILAFFLNPHPPHLPTHHSTPRHAVRRNRHKLVTSRVYAKCTSGTQSESRLTLRQA